MTVFAPRGSAADLLTLGFGTTVAMWTLGYACRLFGDAVPAGVVFALSIVCLVAGGFLAGRCTPRGMRGGVYTGLIAGLLNLLIVGSLISGTTPNSIRSGAALWVPGTLLLSMLITGAAAGLGTLLRAPRGGPGPDWPGLFVVVAVIATFVLLTAGGLVTGFDEGLAVVDWPNTEGYNMFLYPLARMTGGVYLEHAHRLLGSLVGLTALVLAAHVQRSEPRRWVRLLAWALLLAIVAQGVLGGLRVTGRPTLSTRAEDTQPSIVLAVLHGVFGQLVFGGLIALAVFRSRRWQGAAEPQLSRSAGTDRALGGILIALVILQLVLGAMVRHFTWALTVFRYGLEAPPERLAAWGTWALHVHITLAVLVALLASAVGIRAWGLYERVPTLQRLGTTLLVLIAFQLGLGIAALIVTGGNQQYRKPQVTDVIITTLHQVVGAALLAWSVLLVLWNHRLVRAVPAAPAAAVTSQTPTAP